MIASSSTVLSNLAYLIGAIVVAVVGGILVWLRHRQPRSVDANMASFKRGLNALAPDAGPTTGARIHRSEQIQARQAPSLTHVRIDSTIPPGPMADRPRNSVRIEDRVVEDVAVEEVAAEGPGGQTG